MMKTVEGKIRSSIEVSVGMYNTINVGGWTYREVLSAGIVHLQKNCKDDSSTIERLHKVIEKLQEELHRVNDE